MQNDRNKLQFNRRLAKTGAIVMAILLVITAVCSGFSDAYAAEKAGAAKTSEAKTAAKKTAKTAAVTKPHVGASSFIVMSGSTSQDVYSQYPERKMSPGAMTKLMTAMVVIDNMYDDSEWENQLELHDKVVSYGDSFVKGDNLSIRDLMYAMLVGNSDEAAEALARYSASKRSIFVNEMNAKAMELNLENTQFSNPTGSYSAHHYSSAGDCALIMQAAVRYPEIKKMMAEASYTVKITNKKKGERKLNFVNTNPLISGGKAGDQYKGCTGGILGKLNSSTETCQYMGIATINDMQFIVVMMDENEKSLAKEAAALLDYGDKKAARNTIMKADKKCGTARIRGGASTHVAAYTEIKGWAYIPPEGSTDLIKTSVVMTKGLKAPLKAGDKVGEYRIYVADELKGTVDLVIKKDVPQGWLLSGIYISNLATVIGGIIILTLLILILRIRAVNRRRRKKRELMRKRQLRQKARESQALKEDREKRKWTYSGYGIPDEDLRKTLNGWSGDNRKK